MFIMRYTVDPRQGRLFDPFAGIIPPLGRKLINAGWQAIFRAVLLALMPAKELGKHFDPAVGRPTKELYSMAGLLFLQETHNWTNAQAVEAYLFRSDVQFALNLEPGQDEQCERTFERYRQLFLEDDLADQVMDEVTAKLVAELELNVERQRLDSTHIFSNMASFGRTRLMGVTIKRFLTQVPRISRPCPPNFGNAMPRPRPSCSPSKAAQQQTRQQVAEDLRDLIDRFADHAGLHDRPSYQALVTVFQQQCEIVDDKVCVKAKTTGRCVQNPSDPDATYDGHKGPGYQAQLVETCSPTNDVQLIVTALPQTAVESDAEAFVPVLEALAAKEMLPDTMLMDTAYGSDDNVQAAAAQGVDVVSPVAGPKSDTSATPVPEPATTESATTESATAPMEKLTIDDFATDERTGRVDACPSGRIPLKVVRDAETGTTTIEMSPADCQNCPFRQACPIDEKPDGQFRTSYTDKQKRLAGRRQEQRTPVFRERYAARAGIESTNSGLKRRLGLGRLRVRGQRAVFHAIYLKVAGWNLLRAAASGRLRQKVAAYLAQLGLAPALDGLDKARLGVVRRLEVDKSSELSSIPSTCIIIANSRRRFCRRRQSWCEERGSRLAVSTPCLNDEASAIRPG